jgi:DNA-binding LacI/PurR family transcriptional regulator
MACWNEVEEQYAPDDRKLIIEAIKQTNATAIFGNSGGMSSIASEALSIAGIRAPDECCLIGIDVLEANDAFRHITQFVCPGVQIGRAAAELLELRHADTSDVPQHILVPPELRECEGA